MAGRGADDPDGRRLELRAGGAVAADVPLGRLAGALALLDLGLSDFSEHES